MRKLATALVWAASLGWIQAGNPPPFELPFEFRDGFIRIEVSVNEHSEPLTMLFDTGSSVSVLSSSAAARLGLQTGRPVTVRGVQRELQGYWATQITARLGPLRYETDALVVDLGRLSDACEPSVDGLIGADFLRRRTVEIDFEAERIRLLPADRRRRGGDVLPLRMGSGGIQVAVQVNGRKPRSVRLDTGCSSSLHWVQSPETPSLRQAIALIGLAPPGPAPSRAKVKLGNTIFADVPVTVHPREIFPGEFGLLGNGILSRYARVTIDGRSNRLFLEPSDVTLHR